MHQKPSEAAAIWRAHVRAELARWGRNGQLSAGNVGLLVTLWNQVFVEAAPSMGRPAREAYKTAIKCFGCAKNTTKGRQQLAELANMYYDLTAFANEQLD